MPRSPVPLVPHRSASASVAATVLVALLFALLPAGLAHAEEQTVSGGRLDWGIKSSFLTYLTGPTAQGSWSLAGGAGTVGADQFRFHSGEGSYDPDTGAVTARYSGSVHMTGHQDESGEYALDLTVGNPSVEVAGATGTLRADIRSKDRDTGEISDRTAVPLAHLDLGGVDLTGGGTLSVTGIPATLTAEGASSFGGFYEAGDELDPVTLTADTVAAGDGDGASDAAPDADQDDGAADSSEDEDASDADQHEVSDAVVDWGVRRTFREFVTGELTEGSWEMTGAAEDGGALYRFSGGSGSFDADAGTLDAAFDGGVRFTGSDLDLHLESFTVAVEDGTGTLSADVTDRAGDQDLDGETLPLVTFPADELVPEDDLLLIDEAPAELTAAGADAFGLYPEGTDMDPVTVAVPLAADAALPPLPDLGSEPEPDVADAESAAEEPADDAAEAGDTENSSVSTPLLVALGVAAALAVLAAGGYLLTRRRTRATPDGAAASDPQATGPGSGPGAEHATETETKETP